MQSAAITCEILPPERLEAPGGGEALHNLYHRCAHTAAAQATGYAILCGLELQKIRVELSKPGKRTDLNLTAHVRGGWESWVETNCEFSIDTALRYIAVANGVKGRLAQVTASRALLGCIDCQPSAMNETQRGKLLQAVGKVTEGETLRQLYLDFGIIKDNGTHCLTAHDRAKGGKTTNDQKLSDEDLAAALVGSVFFRNLYNGVEAVAKEFSDALRRRRKLYALPLIAPKPTVDESLSSPNEEAIIGLYDYQRMMACAVDALTKDMKALQASIATAIEAKEAGENAGAKTRKPKTPRK
jgi:hypothetical protein